MDKKIERIEFLKQLGELMTAHYRAEQLKYVLPQSAMTHEAVTDENEKLSEFIQRFGP